MTPPPYTHLFDSTTTQLLFTIAFTRLIGLNDTQRKILLETYGSAIDIYHQRNNCAHPFADLNVLTKNLLLGDWPLSEALIEIEFINKHNITATSILDDTYPNRLIQCADAPTVLFIKGDTAFNKKHLVSIVGTRQHTQQAEKVIIEIIQGLRHLDVAIISGMALGIDGIAHKTAIENKIPTWGVLAHGLDQIYPIQHRKLAIEMLANGGLITENKKGTIPLPYFFPKRNRIVAGFSDVTIVVETDIKGGSMITANLAFNYDRSVFAVPGKLHDPKSKGCLQLIKNNKAQMYHDPIDFLESLQWSLPILPKTKSLHSNIYNANQQLDPATGTINDPITKCILELIERQGPIHIDDISGQLKLPTSELSSPLLILEMQSSICKLAGNVYNIL